MTEPGSDKGERFTFWHGLLLAEAACGLIALVMPVTPSKTGTGRGLAHLFYTDPSYLQEVAVYFVASNAAVAVLALVLWLLVRRG